MVGLPLKKVDFCVANMSMGLSGLGVEGMSVVDIKEDCNLRGPGHGKHLDFLFTCADLPS